MLVGELTLLVISPNDPESHVAIGRREARVIEQIESAGAFRRRELVGTIPPAPLA